MESDTPSHDEMVAYGLQLVDILISDSQKEKEEKNLKESQINQAEAHAIFLYLVDCVQRGKKRIVLLCLCENIIPIHWRNAIQMKLGRHFYEAIPSLEGVQEIPADIWKAVFLILGDSEEVRTDYYNSIQSLELKTEFACTWADLDRMQRYDELRRKEEG